MYSFNTHYGVSDLIDTETGLVLQWTNGKFNETQHLTNDAATLMTEIPNGEDPALFLARKMREMADHVVKEYPELI